MSRSPAIPLTQAQIDAANRLQREFLPEWRVSEEILRGLAARYPRPDEHVFPKVLCLNALYSTWVYATRRMSKHIQSILAADGVGKEYELVHNLATLKLGGKVRYFLSFASKYCHFFVDADRYTIFDSFAGSALAHHLGPEASWGSPSDPATYPTYLEAVNSLRSANGIITPNAQLDRYLWLRGKHLAWRKSKQSRRDTSSDRSADDEVQRLFEDRNNVCAQELIAVAFPDQAGLW